MNIGWQGGGKEDATIVANVGNDYDTVYEAIQDGKRIIYLEKDTVEDISWNDISKGLSIKIIGLGVKRTIRLNASNDYSGSEYVEFFFSNIILDFHGTVAFANRCRLEFTENCVVNFNNDNIYCYLANGGYQSEIIADVLNVNVNEIGRFGGYLSIIARKLIITGNIQVNETTSGFSFNYLSKIDYLKLSGYFNVKSSSRQEYYIFNNSGIIEEMVAYLSEHTYITNSGKIYSGKGNYIHIRMEFQSEIYNMKGIDTVFFYSTYPLGLFTVENCEIDRVGYYTVWSGHYSPFKNFRHNWIKYSLLNIYANSGNIENCKLHSVKLFTNGINLTNCNITNGTIDVNNRSGIKLIGNRTATPIINTRTDTQIF